MTKSTLSENDPRLPDIVERLKEGKTTLLAASKSLGFSHNGPLRYTLRKLLGVKPYAKLMHGRSGPAKKSAAKKQKAAAEVQS